MAKYTIETDGITADSIQGYLGFPIEICGKRTWVKTDMKLTPYTEPDLEQVRKEAYQQGLSDAWEAAKKIQDTGGNLNWWIHNTSASECIEKIRQYEQEKLFCVGDEFENESGKRFVITKMDGTEIDRYIDEEGRTYCMIAKYKVIRKTGRHFPEIAEVLAKIREESNG